MTSFRVSATTNCNNARQKNTAEQKRFKMLCEWTALIDSAVCPSSAGPKINLTPLLHWGRTIGLTAAVLLSLMAGSAEAQVLNSRQVAAGEMHVLVARSDGTVWGFGPNTGGELGDGTTVFPGRPVQAIGLTNVTAVAAGFSHSAALKGDGTVWTFGGNTYGQLGDGTTTTRKTPVKVNGLTGVIKIACGAHHTVALKSDGTVWSFGYNILGQLGDWSTTDRHVPVQLIGLRRVVDIAAGAYYTLMVTSSGGVWGVGENSSGQLGDGTSTSRITVAPVSGLGSVVAIAAGYSHSLAMKSDGTLWAWGENGDGQLGDGTIVSRPNAVQVSSLSNVVGISTGQFNSMARKSDGTLWAFGSNYRGQLGDGTMVDRNSPVQVIGPTYPVAVAGGNAHSVVVKSDGSVWTFGDDEYGQSGGGQAANRPVTKPVPVSGLDGTAMVSAGTDRTFSVKSDGTLWTFGYNNHGQLGDGTTTPHSIPAPVASLSGITQTALGHNGFSLALKSDGTVWAFGSNSFGQLGDGTTTNRHIPVQASGLSGVVSVVAGASHTLALKGDGTVWGFGSNAIGQIGGSGFTSSSIAIQVSGLADVVSLTAGDSHSVALKTDGTVWSFGGNGYGQLGDGTMASKNNPVQVSGVGGVEAVSAGIFHTVVLKSDGTVWAFGANMYGQLGDGTTANRSTAVQVNGLTNIIAISACNHNLALKSDGTVWGWGLNHAGQLGEGVQGFQTTPVQVVGLKGATHIAVGAAHSVVLKEDGAVVAFGSSSEGQLGEFPAIWAVVPQPLLDLNLLHPSPTTTIASPATNTAVPLGSTQTVTASISGGDGTPHTVFFYHHGVLLGSDNAAPFTYAFTPTTWGDFEITAVGLDSVGAYSARSTPVTLAVPYDHDDDDLPDWWEVKYFGNLTQSPGNDPDQDGFTNSVEYANRTNPLEAYTIPGVVGSSPSLTWPGNQSGSNSGIGGSLPSFPAELDPGTAVDKSFEDSVAPNVNGVYEDVFQMLAKTVRVDFLKTQADYSISGGTVFPANQKWERFRSGGSWETFLTSPAMTVGENWIFDDVYVVKSFREYADEEKIWDDCDPDFQTGVFKTLEEWSSRGREFTGSIGYDEETDGALGWRYYYYKKYKIIKQDDIETSRSYLGKVRMVIGPGEIYTRQAVEMFPRGGGSLQEGESEEYVLNADDDSGDSASGYSISASDAAGPSYRKVALHGLPLSDSKPQARDESGTQPEQTFVDAFTRRLSHSVSDVYSSVESSLLPLQVRRDAREHVWSLRRGLRPSEYPDAPFGPGWSSNLCANVKVEDWKFHKVTVTDEQGAVATFFRMLKNPPGVPDNVDVWVHSREERQDAKTVYDTLETVRGIYGYGGRVGFTYRKKFGTVCHYELTGIRQAYSNDRVNGSNKDVGAIFARLTSVSDRWGNELQYTYDSSTTLVPSKIHDPNRPSQFLTLTQNDGLVTAVRGPAGDTVHYAYSTQGSDLDEVKVLTSVSRGGNTVHYQYSTEVENTPPGDVDANGPKDPDYRHLALSQITDERNNTYSFQYIFNHSYKYYEVSGEGTRLRSQLGMPRLLSQVTLPNSQQINWSGTREFQLLLNGSLSSASAQTVVAGPAGTYTYTFSQPSVFEPIEQDPDSEMFDPLSCHLTAYFTRMVIASPAGSETYDFDFDHGMALTSAKDLSNNTTTFHYGAVESNGLGWDDPARQVNAKGDSRYFTYDDDTRVMKSVTDERGTLTSYVVNSTTGLRTKETISKGGVVLQETDFNYGAGGFTGFLASKTVQSTSATGGDMVTTYTPDANGRVQKQTVQAGGGIELVTSYTYTGNGSKNTVKNPRGHTTTFTYDTQSLRLEKVENPDGSERTLDYDAHGNLVEEVNERNVTTTHVYDVLNRRTSSTVDMDVGPDLVSSTTYNAFNLPVTQTDPRGTVTTYTYDNIGRRLTSTVGSGLGAQTTTFTYGTNSGGSVFEVSGFKPTTITDPRDNVTTNTYDDLYRLTVQDGPEGYKVTTTYDDVGNPVEVKDALNRITTTTFDGLNRPTKVEYPDSTTRWSYYTPAGQVWKVKDELGRETLTQYDRAGRPLEVTQPEVNGVSPVIKTAYDACGNVIAAQDALGNIATTVYDNRNRPTKVIAPYLWDAIAGEWARPEVSTTYDVGSNVLTVTDALGAVTTSVYDNANRVIRVTDALSHITEQDYDPNGNVVETRDALNREVHNTYDAFNRLVETEDAEEQVTEFAYDKNGNRTSVTDPRGKVTTFTYDGLNRLKKETFQEGVWVEHFYNAVRETSREDSAGREFTFAYDLRDRLTGTTWPVGGSPVTRTRVYDLAGNLTSVTETGRPEALVGYTYDDLNRVATETSQGLTHTYTYDLAGRRTQTDLGTGRTLTSTFDSQGKPLTITEDGRTTTYHYDLAGCAVAQAQANGAWQYNGYDVLGRLQYRQMFDGTSALLSQMLWTHDAVGNVTSQSERWPGDATRGNNWRSTAMVYDDINRLVGEAVVTTGGTTTATGYAYDEGSNRILKQVSTNGSLTTSTGYTYNDFNQLTAWTEDNSLAVTTRVASFTYDNAGNRATQSLTVTGQPADLTTYHWDAENRLEGVTLPNTDEHEYNYDYRMRRISRLENGVGSAIVFSGGTSVAEYEGGGLTPTVEYLRGPDMGGGVGGLLYSLRSGGTVPKYSLSNGRGDVVGQSDGTGDLTWTASYEAYGKRTVETGTNLDRQRANTKEEDPTGLLNEGFRYRDLETGVWLSRDPAGFVDGPNLYAYVRQNPWTAFDPEGLWEILGERPGQFDVKRKPDGGYAVRGYEMIVRGERGIPYNVVPTPAELAVRNFFITGNAEYLKEPGVQTCFDLGLENKLLLNTFDPELGSALTGSMLITPTLSREKEGSGVSLPTRRYTNGAKPELPKLFKNLGDQQEVISVGQLQLSGEKWKLRMPNGELRTASGKMQFVKTSDGRLLAHPNAGHTGISQGKDVLYAGEVNFSHKGQLKEWNNASGHYRPSSEYAGQAGLPMEKFRPLPDSETTQD